MAKIQHVYRTELDPLRPVPEILSVIEAYTAANPQHEEVILKGVADVIEKRREQLKKGDDQVDRRNQRNG